MDKVAKDILQLIQPLPMDKVVKDTLLHLMVKDKDILLLLILALLMDKDKVILHHMVKVKAKVILLHHMVKVKVKLHHTDKDKPVQLLKGKDYHNTENIQHH